MEHTRQLTAAVSDGERLWACVPAAIWVRNVPDPAQLPNPGDGWALRGSVPRSGAGGTGDGERRVDLPDERLQIARVP